MRKAGAGPPDAGRAVQNGFFAYVMVVFLFFLPPFPAAADETDLLDRDVDSLFDEPFAVPGTGEGTAEGGETVKEETGENPAAVNVLSDLLRRIGFSLDAYYFFFGGVAPGFREAPWFGGGRADFSHGAGGGMNSGLALDVQVSKYLRVKNDFQFSLPPFKFLLNELFFDYNLQDYAFFRVGRYSFSWGISPNYPYTDLLARVPTGSSGGDSYFARGNIPLGIGGLEFLAMTRTGFVSNINAPDPDEIGYGGRFNLAFTWADMDFGFFYLKQMPFRQYVSVKSTVFDTEVYAEALLSMRHDPWSEMKFSASFGFIRFFFGEKLRLNGEFYYNGESNVLRYNPRTNIREEETVPFIGGYNCAFNVVYSPGFNGLHLFTQCLYAVNEKSVQLVPGLYFDPFPHIRVSMAIPMALGSRNGTYYTSNADKFNRPVSLVLLVSLSGSYRYSHSD
ncbi:MAG: hypothetical protein LBK08_12455 [Treponema sp.]|jgi:hypothetical protein|nr:hypothetical protein [Treponema sp.]